MSVSRHTNAGLTFGTTARIIGLWVPAEMFGAGCCIEARVDETSGESVMNMGIGGDASAVGLGVVAGFASGDADSRGMWSIVGAEAPGDFVATTYSGQGGWIGTTSTGARWTANIHIQPLNFVELYAGVSSVVRWASLTVSSPSSTQVYSADSIVSL